MNKTSRSLRRGGKQTILFALFLLVACLALYVLLFNGDTHVGGAMTTDYFMFNWNYWWLRHALTSPDLHVYSTDYVLFPSETNLAYHTLAAAWYPVWALTEPLVGTLQAVNVIFVLALALNGSVFYRLLLRERVAPLLALPLALVFVLTPATMLAVNLSWVNYASVFWYPLLLLLWGNIAAHADDPRRALMRSLVLGVAFYGMLLTDLQHGLFVGVILAPYGVLTLIAARSWSARGRLVGYGLVAVALGLVLLWAAGPLVPLLTFERESLSPMPIADAQGIPFPGGYVQRLDPYTRVISLGALVLPLVVVSLLASFHISRHQPGTPGSHSPSISLWGGVNPPTVTSRWFWLALMLPPLLVSSSATIDVFGQSLSTPYVLLHDLFGGLFRNPARFAPVILIPALIFIGQTWSAVLPRRRAARLLVFVALLLVVMAESRLFQPMLTQPVIPHRQFYERIGQERGDPYDQYGIIEVPNAGGTGEAWVGDFKPMELQFHGITHGKKMLNGSLARAPLDHYWSWLYDDALLAWLGQRRYLEPALVEAQLRERIFDDPIGYIVIHQDLVGRFTPTNQEIIGYFNTLPDLLCPVWVEADAVAYRTAWHPDGCPGRTPPQTAPGVYTIDIGSPGDERYIGWGWHWHESVAGLTLRWSGEYPETRLYLDLPPGAYALSFAAQAFWAERAVTVRVNGESVGAVTVTTGSLASFAVSVPAAVIGDGRHVEVVFAYDAVVVPADVGQSDDPRKLAIAVDWVAFATE